jgi:proline dehydrogenase
MDPSVLDISFDNTEYAFAYKTDAELAKAKLLFLSMHYPWLVKLGTFVTPTAIKMGLPIRGLLKKTLFGQFVGGETLEETAEVADRLEKFNVQVILDYGVEGKEGEDSFDHACEEFIRVVRYASTQENIPFISIKVTGIARFALLEKLDAAATPGAGINGVVNTAVLSEDEMKEWGRVIERMEKIVFLAAEKRVGVLVDAEESWIQEPVDALCMQMMEKYNRTEAVVYNTVQLYRVNRLQFLEDCLYQCMLKNFKLGVKLVRGAYMEKERKRAAALNYPSPIQPDKVSSDRDYNLAIELAIGHLQHCAVIVASHNEYSNLLAAGLLSQSSMQNFVHFSQLYGMSDNITFNLARAGFSVSKYLPFGPVQDVVPYLMRRAQENSSVSGHTGRELGLIKKEVERRKGKNQVMGS